MRQEDDSQGQNVQWLVQKAEDEADRKIVLQQIAARVFRTNDTIERVRDIYVERGGRGMLLVTVDNRVYAVDDVTGSVRPIIKI